MFFYFYGEITVKSEYHFRELIQINVFIIFELVGLGIHLIHHCLVINQKFVQLNFSVVG